jgi:uncharacterized membrane protein HdeD (DUF308 family)
MAALTGVVGWFLIVCGVAAFVVPLVIRVPDPEAAEKTIWGRVRDPVTLLGLGLLTLYFPLRVHVLVFVATLAGGWFIRRTRVASSGDQG